MAKKYSPEWWQAQRPEVVGRETEKLVEDVLSRQNSRGDTAHLRFPDAKAARGLLKAQISDYLVVARGQSYFIEAKALKHLSRLPKDRLTQLPLLKKFQMAGASGIVLIHHYMSGVWRAVNIAHLEFGVPRLSSLVARDRPNRDR